jgi:protease-4
MSTLDPSHATPPATAPAAAPAAAERPRGGFARGFGLGLGASLGVGAVLTVLSVISTIALVLGGLALASAAPGAAVTEGPATSTVWGDPEAEGRLLAVPVEGAIMGSASDGVPLGGVAFGYEIADLIDDVEAEDADGLLLEMNTPGGTIYGSRAIADAVARYQERTGNPVVAFVRGLSASGGMYAMSGADEIIADHGSLVGSIGVISGPFERYRDVTGIPGSLLAPGVQTEGGVTSEYLTQGRGKDFGNPYRDMTGEEREIWTAGLAREYDAFTTAVAEGRGMPKERIVNELGAFLYDGQTAVDKGLVDQVLGQEEAYRAAAERSEVDPDDTRVDRVVGPTLVESLLAASAERVAPGAGGAAAAGGPAPVEAAARASVLCSGAAIALVYSGDLAAVCPAG